MSCDDGNICKTMCFNQMICNVLDVIGITRIDKSEMGQYKIRQRCSDDNNGNMTLFGEIPDDPLLKHCVDDDLRNENQSVQFI